MTLTKTQKFELTEVCKLIVFEIVGCLFSRLSSLHHYACRTVTDTSRVQTNKEQLIIGDLDIYYQSTYRNEWLTVVTSTLNVFVILRYAQQWKQIILENT